MARDRYRLIVTLSREHAEKLARLAERTHVGKATLAQFLLSSALDEPEADPRHIVGLLDGIPGAFEGAQAGLEHVSMGRTVPLNDL